MTEQTRRALLATRPRPACCESQKGRDLRGVDADCDCFGPTGTLDERARLRFLQPHLRHLRFHYLDRREDVGTERERDWLHDTAVSKPSTVGKPRERAVTAAMLSNRHSGGAVQDRLLENLNLRGRISSEGTVNTMVHIEDVLEGVNYLTVYLPISS